MKRNKFAILAAIVLGLVALWLYMNDDTGTIDTSIRHFNIEDPAKINKIALTKSNSRIELKRQPSGDWMLNGTYIPNNNTLKALLYTIKNIEVKEPVSKKAQSDVLKDLVNNGIKCELFQDDRLIKAYYIGKETPDHSGTYMVQLDTKTLLPYQMPFMIYIPGVDSNLAPNYSIEERIWRERTVFHYNTAEIRSVKMETPEQPDAGYEIVVNKPGEFQITISPKKSILKELDTSAVKQYLSYFEQLGFESFVSDLSMQQRDSILRSIPLTILTVTDTTGKNNKMQFYHLKNKGNSVDKDGKQLKYDPDNMLAIINNGKDLVSVKYYEFGKVMPPVSYFQGKR